jgi:hypothetical protein
MSNVHLCATGSVTALLASLFSIVTTNAEMVLEVLIALPFELVRSDLTKQKRDGNTHHTTASIYLYLYTAFATMNVHV